jgi:hypothetical protein
MYSKHNAMHTLRVVGKPDIRENGAASVVSAKKTFHMVGSYFVPSFVSPSLVKRISIFLFHIYSMFQYCDMIRIGSNSYACLLSPGTITHNSVASQSIKEILLGLIQLRHSSPGMWPNQPENLNLDNKWSRP